MITVPDEKKIDLNLFQVIGALAGDLVELAKDTGEGVSNIPDNLVKGFDTGLLIETDYDRRRNELLARLAELKAAKGSNDESN